MHSLLETKAQHKAGAIAQLVEQRTENPCVPGSIPGGTTKKRELRKSSLFLWCHWALVCYLSPKPPFCKGGLYIQQKRNPRNNFSFCNTTRALVCYLSPKPPFCKEGLYIQQKRNPRNDFSFLQYHQGTGVTYLPSLPEACRFAPKQRTAQKAIYFSSKGDGSHERPQDAPFQGVRGCK